VLAVDVVHERVGIEYFIVHCERTSHRNGYRVVCELGTIETFGPSGGLRAIVREKDALLGAVIDGEEGEAEYQEEIGACVSINHHVQRTGNAISRGLNRFHHELDIRRLFALVCWRSTCLFRTFHTSSA